MVKSLKSIKAQGALLSKKISEMPKWGQTTEYEESKLDPLTRRGYN